MIIPAAGQCVGLGLEMPTANEYPPLQFDELVQREPPHCDHCVSDSLREVQHANRLGTGEENSCGLQVEVCRLNVARGRFAGGGWSCWNLQLATCNLQPYRFRPGLRNLSFEPVERPPNKRPQPALREAICEWVDWRQPAEMDDLLFAV